MIYWAIQDVDDELLAALDFLRAGDSISASDEVRGCEYHARARRHIVRARALTSVLVEAERAMEAEAANQGEQQEASAASSPAPSLTPSRFDLAQRYGVQAGAETAAQADAESATAEPSAFIGGDAQLMKAFGGPYKDQTLVIYPDRTRWVVRDAGGSRSSVHATNDAGPIDAIPSHLFPGLTVEGYYRADQLSGCATWMPVAGMADRPASKLS
jgi:hypothetical protein